MNKQEVLKLIAILEMAYPRQELKQNTVEVYAMFLQDLDYKMAERVVGRHIKTQKWFPTIAEIREAYAEMVHGIASAEEAISTIRQAASQNDYLTVKQNPLLKQAVATVGWLKLTTSEYSDPLYRQIKDAYLRLREIEIRSLMALPQAGLMAIDYETKAKEE